MKTAFFFITGTSGSGKSTLEKTLRQQLNSELFAVYDFDEKGVPINADQVWRQKTTQFWLEKGIEHDRLGQYMILYPIRLKKSIQRYENCRLSD